MICDRNKSILKNKLKQKENTNKAWQKFANETQTAISGRKEFISEMQKGLYGIFINYNNANSFSDKSTKTSMIILGDNEEYWVVTLRLAGFLEKSGCEIVNL